MATPSRPSSGTTSSKGLVRDCAVAIVVAGLLGGLSAIAFPTSESGPIEAGRSSPLETTSRAGVFDLAPVVTNLAAPHDTWVRLEASIVYDSKSLSHPESQAAQISGDIMAYLRTLTIGQLEGPIGLQNLREDLSERAVARSGGAVQEVVVRTLVVQ